MGNVSEIHRLAKRAAFGTLEMHNTTRAVPEMLETLNSSMSSKSSVRSSNTPKPKKPEEPGSSKDEHETKGLSQTKENLVPEILAIAEKPKKQRPRSTTNEGRDSDLHLHVTRPCDSVKVAT